MWYRKFKKTTYVSMPNFSSCKLYFYLDILIGKHQLLMERVSRLTFLSHFIHFTNNITLIYLIKQCNILHLFLYNLNRP